MKTKEEIREALKSCIVSTIKENNELHLYASFDVLADKMMEFIPKWYKTSAELPGDMDVKKPEEGSTILFYYAIHDIIVGRIPECCVYYRNHPMPSYWYPVEPLSIEQP